jgi:hypothetical protein
MKIAELFYSIRVRHREDRMKNEEQETRNEK